MLHTTMAINYVLCLLDFQIHDRTVIVIAMFSQTVVKNSRHPHAYQHILSLSRSVITKVNHKFTLAFLTHPEKS